MARRYTLYIDAFSPETIPMARLAEYMQQLAAMFGNEYAVHFEQLKPGSTQLVSRIDKEHVPKVAAVIDALASGDGTPETVDAQEAIDRLLADDNATGFLYKDDDFSASIIDFPGTTAPRPVPYGPIREEGTLDGILVSVGGTDETIHIRLQNGEIKYSNIDTDCDTARHLAKHLFEPIRVFGTGRWLREEDGAWTLKRFKVDRFEVLKTNELRVVVDELRAIGGSEWADQENPLKLLRQLRDEGSGPH